MIKKGAVDDLAAIADDLVGERMINWPLDDDAVALLGEEAEQNRQGRHYAGAEEDILFGHIPIKLFLVPAGDGLLASSLSYMV